MISANEARTLVKASRVNTKRINKILEEIGKAIEKKALQGLNNYKYTVCSIDDRDMDPIITKIRMEGYTVYPVKISRFGETNKYDYTLNIFW
jgi:hypothetical protein